jgi:hypothetical protein
MLTSVIAKAARVSAAVTISLLVGLSPALAGWGWRCHHHGWHSHYVGWHGWRNGGYYGGGHLVWGPTSGQGLLAQPYYAGYNANCTGTQALYDQWGRLIYDHEISVC